RTVDATSANAAVVAISIMSAVDGCDHEKFDVRNREMRTPLNLEIDRDDVFANAHTELRNWDVLRIGLVGVERGAIRKGDRETGIVGTRRAHDVLANLQIDHAV